MSRRHSIESAISRLVWWTVKLTLGLFLGLFLYLIVRLTPPLYRRVVRANHAILPKLEGSLQGLFGRGVRLFTSSAVTVVVSALFWTVIALGVGTILSLGVVGALPNPGSIGFIALCTAGLLLGLLSGWKLVEERRWHKRLTSIPLAGDLPPGFVTEEDQGYNGIQDPVRLQVDVPFDALFDPLTSTSLLARLRALNTLIDLEILASSKGFSFEIITPRDKLSQLKGQVRAAYPQASLASKPVAQRDALVPFAAGRSYLYSLAAHPGRFYAPIKSLTEVKVDSLGAVVQPLAHLHRDERVVIQYLIRPAQFPDWRELGLRQIRPRQSKWLNLFVLGALMGPVWAFLMSRGREDE